MALMSVSLAVVPGPRTHAIISYGFPIGDRGMSTVMVSSPPIAEQTPGRSLVVLAAMPEIEVFGLASRPLRVRR